MILFCQDRIKISICFPSSSCKLPPIHCLLLTLQKNKIGKKNRFVRISLHTAMSLSPDVLVGWLVGVCLREGGVPVRIMNETACTSELSY